MERTQTSETRKTRSCTLVITIAVVVLLTLGYTIFRAMTVPRPSVNQTTQPAK